MCPHVQLVNWTFPEEAPQFVSLSDHCAYRQLLHLPGNSYAGAGGLGKHGARPGHHTLITSCCSALLGRQQPVVITCT